jgi:hypothetical protein
MRERSGNGTVWKGAELEGKEYKKKDVDEMLEEGSYLRYVARRTQKERGVLMAGRTTSLRLLYTKFGSLTRRWQQTAPHQNFTLS